MVKAHSTVIYQGVALLTIAVSEHQVVVSILVQVCNGNVDGCISGSTNWLSVPKTGIPTVKKNHVRFPAARGKDIHIPITVEIRQRQASNTAQFTERLTRCKLPSTVIEEYLIRCHVIANRDIQIAVTIQISQFRCIRCPKIPAQRSLHIEPPAGLIQKQIILLWPMPAVGDNNIQIVVIIKIPHSHRSRQIDLRPQCQSAATDQSNGFSADSHRSEHHEGC